MPSNNRGKMLTIEQLRKIWNTNGCSYSDEELQQIGEFVLMITEVIVDTCKEQKRKAHIIELKPASHEQEQGNPVRQGKHRRAS